MLNHIIHTDQQLFLFLNSFHSPFFDQVMHTVSGVVIWFPLYLAILVYLGRKFGRKFLILLLFVALAATLSDQLSVLIKNLVQRPRPCHEAALNGLVHIVMGQCGGRFGFLSSHATNTFDVALLSLLFIRRKWYSISIIIWASAVSYSRIYLGVHYPLDVFCGAILGSLIGWGTYTLFMITERKILCKYPFFNPSPSA
jgi:undecaprenyl-diphosphatase